MIETTNFYFSIFFEFESKRSVKATLKVVLQPSHQKYVSNDLMSGRMSDWFFNVTVYFSQYCHVILVLFYSPIHHAPIHLGSSSSMVGVRDGSMNWVKVYAESMYPIIGPIIRMHWTTAVTLLMYYFAIENRTRKIKIPCHYFPSSYIKKF